MHQVSVSRTFPVICIASHDALPLRNKAGEQRVRRLAETRSCGLAPPRELGAGGRNPKSATAAAHNVKACRSVWRVARHPRAETRKITMSGATDEAECTDTGHTVAHGHGHCLCISTQTRRQVEVSTVAGLLECHSSSKHEGGARRCYKHRPDA
jgi:hypothetical protein